MEKVSIPLPTDVVCGKAFSESAEATLKSVDDVGADDMIFDIGPDSAKALAEQLKEAKTIIWNGPVGVFEFDQFGEGTKTLSLAIAESPAFSIAGGGDRSEEHTSELQSRPHLVCRLLLEKKKKK